MSLLKRSQPILYILLNGNKKTFEAVLEENKFQDLSLKSLKEIADNVLYQPFNFTKAQRTNLKKIKPFISDLTKGSTSKKAEREVKLQLVRQNRLKVITLLRIFFKTLARYAKI